MIRAGDTLLSTRRDLEEHLWIVVSDPRQDPDAVLVVNLTSWREDKDDSCLLGPGDHPFVAHKSCISYRGGNLTTIATIEHALQAGVLQIHDPVSAEVLARIRAGAAISRFIPMRHAQLLADQGLID